MSGGGIKNSIVTDSDGHIIGVDSTVYHADGSSTTTHQKAHLNPFLSVEADEVIGVTENHKDGTSEHHEGKKGCFLSTACMEYAGLDDNCYELTVLRSFRDNYVACLPDGLAMIAEYYKTAPAIVQKIEQSDNRDAILDNIFATVTKAVALIEGGNYKEAFECYETMFTGLRE